MESYGNTDESYKDYMQYNSCHDHSGYSTVEMYLYKRDGSKGISSNSWGSPFSTEKGPELSKIIKRNSSRQQLLLICCAILKLLANDLLCSFEIDLISFYDVNEVFYCTFCTDNL